MAASQSSDIARSNGAVDQRILALLEEMKAGNKYLERLVIKAGGRIYFLETTEIDWIEAEGNYVSVHSAKEIPLASRNHQQSGVSA